MISTAGLHWWMSKHGLRTRRSVSVFIHSEETPRFSLESVANHDHWPRTAVKTQQGCWCRSFRLFTSLLPTRLLDHYWCNLWVKRTQTCFSSSWADHLLGLQRSWILRICCRALLGWYVNMINPCISQSQRIKNNKRAWWFTMNLCISQKYNMRFPTSHVYLWLTKHA